MGYKLKTHSGAAKRFKKTGTSLKSKSANRNHMLTKQSTKRKRHNRGLNKLTGTVLKMASKLINRHGGYADRIGLYAPYNVSDNIWRQLLSDLKA